MTYDRAVLGESLDLCKDAANWFLEEKKRLENNKKASKEVMDSIRPMVERNRQMLMNEKNQKNGDHNESIIPNHRK